MKKGKLKQITDNVNAPNVGLVEPISMLRQCLWLLDMVDVVLLLLYCTRPVTSSCRDSSREFVFTEQFTVMVDLCRG